MNPTHDRSSMPAGRGIGITLVVLGILASCIAWWLLSSGGSTPKILVGGPAMVLVGMAMIVLPGSREAPVSDPNAWLSAAPWPHKLVWMASGILGVVLAFRHLLS